MILLFISVLASAQPSTEVYLFNIEKTESGFVLSSPINISNNEGYDNQPSFTKNGKAILFASTRNGQTDILKYDIESGSKTWLSDTPGGEYSPVHMSNGNFVSAVRLDPDGLQRLYKYPFNGGEPAVLVKDLIIGYYTFFQENTIIAFVLDEPQTLQEINLSNGDSKIMYNNPGRSIHYIPESNRYSFIDKSDPDEWKIMSAIPNNPESTKSITTTLPGVEDMAWFNGNTILIGKESTLYFFNTNEEDGNWKLLADLSEFNLTGISRLAIKENYLAVVVEGK